VEQVRRAGMLCYSELWGLLLTPDTRYAVRGAANTAQR